MVGSKECERPASEAPREEALEPVSESVLRRHPALVSVIVIEITAIVLLGAITFVVLNEDRIREVHPVGEQALQTLDYEAARVAAQISGATLSRTYERRDNFNFVRAEYLIRFDPAPASEIRDNLSNWQPPIHNQARDCEERGVSAIDVQIHGAEDSGIVDRLEASVSAKLCP